MSWKPKNIKVHGVDDMALLTKTDAAAIVENLKKRFMADIIYTYIGSVLIAVNPFKNIPIYTEKEIAMYRECAYYENPPHIYALADNMYRSMFNNKENQCVIISGESGAGKTVSAKHVMNLIVKISGGGEKAKYTKDVILDSNPLLEAFGNAKTLRNNNSSRFGKYIEIQFAGAQPVGGMISNFLLEKSRVVGANKDERSFHIFYQLIEGSTDQEKSDLGLTECNYFEYLSQTGCYTVENVNDVEDFNEVKQAMKTMKINEDIQSQIFETIAAILHIGNITFMEEGNKAKPADDAYLEFPSYLLGVNSKLLMEKLVYREMESKWGQKCDVIQMENNTQQAAFARDALSKALYSRIFDYLVQIINKAIVIKNEDLINLGILDIYGFEIFKENGFEQFCINYVNEKLQQIFIELTLKKEQEEYNEEGIKWNPIKYTDNKPVCDLIESKNPVGLISVMDDVCSVIQGKAGSADDKLIKDISSVLGNNPCMRTTTSSFTIYHYAGNVTYEIQNMCEKNRDSLNRDLIILMQTSEKPFLKALFNDNLDINSKKRPLTAGTQIRMQANSLVDKLMKCSPHYIRCIKPNETKRARDFDDTMVSHQVKYQGLPENVRLKRAGWAFRREFDKFMIRYSILSEETNKNWTGSIKDGCLHICKSVGLPDDQFQAGRTKIFIQKAESLFLLEERMTRIYDFHASRIQSIWYKNNSKISTTRKSFVAAKLYNGRKERQFGSICRNFHGDYIGLEYIPEIHAFVDHKEKVIFAEICHRLTRKFKLVLCEVLLTGKHLYVIGREKIKKGPEKGKIVKCLEHKLLLGEISSVALSPYQDNFVLIKPESNICFVLYMRMKTEFLFLLNEVLCKVTNSNLAIDIVTSSTFEMKKEGITFSKNVTLDFKEAGDLQISLLEMKSLFGKCSISVCPGLAANTDPKTFMSNRRNHDEYRDNRFECSSTMDRSQLSSSASSNQRNVSSKSAKHSESTSAAQKKVNQKSDKNSSYPPSKPLPPRPQVSAPPKQEKWKALYDYDAGDHDELSFRVGDIVVLLVNDDSGWFKVKLNRKEGMVPGNYFEKINN